MKVGVIGAGVMGSGIAQTFAMAQGYEVVLCDIKQEYADGGKERIAKSLARLVDKGKMDAARREEILAGITTGENDAVAGCSLVVEAAVENMPIKKELFAKLNSLCGPNTLFATNTSSLSVTELSAGVGRHVVGMHFFNPAPVMKLVEIVVGLGTPQAMVDTIRSICGDIGKTPVEVQDAAGFVVNRLLVPMVNEAIGIYAEGVASAEGIDEAMKLGANHPMGPLALGDLIGLDVCLAIMETLHVEMGEDKYRPHPLLRKMVRGGKLGRKSGTGFYEY